MGYLYNYGDGNVRLHTKYISKKTILNEKQKSSKLIIYKIINQDVFDLQNFIKYQATDGLKYVETLSI